MLCLQAPVETKTPGSRWRRRLSSLRNLFRRCLPSSTSSQDAQSYYSLGAVADYETTDDDGNHVETNMTDKDDVQDQEEARQEAVEEEPSEGGDEEEEREWKREDFDFYF